ncbi:repressor LexA [Candidatus Gottesmanbacteria bacterium]|nr:repressor LexA [Candidatus Gottesmanbacteria bacterium]
MLPFKQKEVLDFINQYQRAHGHGPTLDEIAEKLKRAVPTIHQHVQVLRAKGYLRLPSSSARGIGVFDPHEEIVEIPLLGVVSAGGGIENLENPEPIKVQRAMLSPMGQHYALVVRGTSMIEDGILPEDVVIIKYQNYADNGDVVVALIGNDGHQLATIKRFYNLGSKIELRAKNPGLKPKKYNPGEIEIRGKFVGLLRKG